MQNFLNLDRNKCSYKILHLECLCHPYIPKKAMRTEYQECTSVHTWQVLDINSLSGSENSLLDIFMDEIMNWFEIMDQLKTRWLRELLATFTIEIQELSAWENPTS